MSHSKDPEKVAAYNRYQLERHHERQRQYEANITPEIQELHGRERELSMESSRWDTLKLKDPEKAKQIRAEYFAVVNKLKAHYPPNPFGNTSRKGKEATDGGYYQEFKLHMHKRII